MEFKVTCYYTSWDIYRVKAETAKEAEEKMDSHLSEMGSCLDGGIRLIKSDENMDSMSIEEVPA